MKIFVTGVGGQLGHDVVNELCARGHEVFGSDLAGEYSGTADGTAVTALTSGTIQMVLTGYAIQKDNLASTTPASVWANFSS